MSAYKSANHEQPSLDPDLEAVEAFKRGDPASFEKIMVKYYKRILNFVYRYVGIKEVAEDLTQDVFIKVYNNINRFTPKAKFATWLFTIARNHSLNELRRLKKNAYSLDQSFDLGEGTVQAQVADEKSANPNEALSMEERKQIVKKAIDELPENQRAAVLLRRYENFSYEEIATAMNTSVKAVKSLLNRAKENLKNKLSGII